MEQQNKTTQQNITTSETVPAPETISAGQNSAGRKYEAVPEQLPQTKNIKAPDSPLLQYMKEHFTWFGKTACLFGLIYTFCLFDNPAGVTFPAAVAAVILFSVLWLGKAGIPWKRGLFFYFAGMLLLGISTCMTANAWIHLFNRVGILLLFCTGMLHQMYEDSRWSFSANLKQLLFFAGTCFVSLFKPFEHMLYSISKHKAASSEEALQKRANLKKKAPAVLTGAAIAALFLLCVMPLLIGSDPVFASYFRIRITIPDIPDLTTAVRICWSFLSGFFMLYVFFAALFRQNLKSPTQKEGSGANALIGITFTMTLAFIYVIYSGIQILFLFLRRGLPDGMTYSQYAHQGFWQLLAVSLINLVTVMVCIQVFETRRALNVLLLVISVCTCVMTLSAAYRMLLYVGVYHLTFLRILVLWFLGVLTLIMGGVMVSIFRQAFPLFRYTVTVVTCCYLVFSFAGVDRIIASYNLRHMEQITWQDVNYLLHNLSVDAAPYVAQMADIKMKTYIYTEDDRYYYRDEPYEFKCQEDLSKFETIGEYLESQFEFYMEGIYEFRKPNLREWNFAEARAWKTAEEYLAEH